MHYENGQYLIELDQFVPLANGKITYRPIAYHKGFVIKLEKNGTLLFSVWKGKRNLEDRINSIAHAKEIIEELKAIGRQSKIDKLYQKITVITPGKAYNLLKKGYIIQVLGMDKRENEFVNISIDDFDLDWTKKEFLEHLSIFSKLQYTGEKYAKGGNTSKRATDVARSPEEYDKLVDEKTKIVKDLSPAQIAKMWNKETTNTLKNVASKKMIAKEAKAPHIRMYLRNMLVEKDLNEIEYEKYFALGGATTEFSNGGDIVKACERGMKIQTLL